MRSIQQNINDTVSQLTTSQATTSLLVKEQQITSYRWLILFLFCLDEIVVSILFMTCNPIAVTNALIVGGTITIQMFMYPICTFPASYFIDKYGLSAAVKFGSLIVVIGVCLRCLVYFEDQFYWVLLGSTIVGIGRPLIINAQGDMVQIWFPPSDRTKIISLTNFLVTLSLILGTVISATFFSGYELNLQDEDSILVGKQKFIRILIFEALCAGFSLCLTLSFFKSKRYHIEREKMKILEQIKAATKNCGFISLLFAYSICFGNFKAYGVVSPYMVHVYGFGSSDIAILCMIKLIFTQTIAMCPIIGGIISTPFTAKAYKVAKSYKVLCVVSLTLCALTFMLNYIVLIHRMFLGQMLISLVLLIYYISKLQGMFVMPLIPLLLEWACQTIRPVSDSFVIGVLYSGATLAGSLLGEIDIKIVNGEKADESNVLFTSLAFIICFVIANLLCIFTTERKNSIMNLTVVAIDNTDSNQSEPTPIYTQKIQQKDDALQLPSEQAVQQSGVKYS